MTFLIEPGLAPSHANSKSERVEPKQSQSGSGDAFARSLEASRSATEESADTSTSAKGKKLDSERPQSPLSLLQGDESDVALKSDALTETDDPDASGDAAAVSNSVEEVLAQESKSELETAEAPEENRDHKEVFLASAETESAAGVKSDPDAVPQESANAQPQASPPPSDVQAMTMQAASPGEAGQNTTRVSDRDVRLGSSAEVKGPAAAAETAPQQAATAPESKKDMDPADRPANGKAGDAFRADLSEMSSETGSETGKTGTAAEVKGPAAAAETAPQQAATAPESKKDMDPADRPANGKAGDAFRADLSEVSSETGSETGKTGTAAQMAHSPDSNGQLAAASFGASPASQPAAQPAQSQIQMTPANAIVTASPAETVKIITDTVSSPNDPPDRITVQLDPPELGRVSIDFKFDAHGIQHITVTGDSPEALRQLRLMHFELTQALERNGLSSENMTFQQQQSGQQQSHTPAGRRLFGDSGPVAEPAILTAANITADSIRPARTASGGLDIRL
jgi:hypothetical protein